MLLAPPALCVQLGAQGQQDKVMLVWRTGDKDCGLYSAPAHAPSLPFLVSQDVLSPCTRALPSPPRVPGHCLALVSSGIGFAWQVLWESQSLLARTRLPIAPE